MKQIWALALLLLVFGTGLYLYVASDGDIIEDNDALPGVLVYDSEEAGIRFSYPERFGEADWGSALGATGKKYTAQFKDFDGFQLGGITDDFSAGRGGMLTDTRGFLKLNGQYYFLFVGAKPDTEYPIIPRNVLQTELGEVLVLDDKSFEGERLGLDGPIMGVGKGNLAALVRTGPKEYPGLVFWNMNVAEFSEEEFEAMLLSLQRSEVTDTTLLEYTDEEGFYSLKYPEGWYPHPEGGDFVLFTKTEELVLPDGTEGSVLGSNFAIQTHQFTDAQTAESYEDFLTMFKLNKESDVLKERTTVTQNGFEMIRAISEAASTAGDVLTYVYFANAANIVMMFHYPYDPESQDSKDFETSVQHFAPAVHR